MGGIAHNLSICVRAGLPKPRGVPDTERIKDTKMLDYASTPLDANTVLSQKRTEAVKTYLMGRGIMESRLTAVGYGETKPIADNKTAAGRAKNRRVELKTSY